MQINEIRNHFDVTQNLKFIIRVILQTLRNRRHAIRLINRKSDYWLERGIAAYKSYICSVQGRNDWHVNAFVF